MIDVDAVQKKVEALERGQVLMMRAINKYEELRHQMQDEGYKFTQNTTEARWVTPVDSVSYSEQVQYTIGLTKVI